MSVIYATTSNEDVAAENIEDSDYKQLQTRHMGRWLPIAGESTGDVIILSGKTENTRTS